MKVDANHQPKIKLFNDIFVNEICNEFDVKITLRGEAVVEITIVGCKENIEAAQNEIQRLITEQVCTAVVFYR